LDFLGELYAETDVARVVTDDDDGLETGALSGLGLLLDGNDLHDLIGEILVRLFNKFINNGCLLDGDRVSVDFLEGVDVSILDETAELGLRNPLVFSGTAGSAAEAAATTATTTVTTTASTASIAASIAKSTATTAAFNSFSFGCFTFHLILQCL
jgi:hypothetical protein